MKYPIPKKHKKIKGRILFDLGHGEDSSVALADRLPEEGFLYDVTEKLLTFDKLKQYTALIINNPRSDCFGEEYVEIDKYITNGGGVVLITHFNDESDYEIYKNKFLFDVPNVLDGDFSYTEDNELDSFRLRIPNYFHDKNRHYNTINLYLNESFKASDIILGEYIIHPHETTNGIKFLPKEKHSPSRDGLMYFFSYSLTTSGVHKVIISRQLKFPTNPKNLQEGIKNHYEKVIPLDLCERILKYKNQRLNEFYGKIGVLSVYGKGRCVGLGGNFFHDLYIADDKEKNSNLRLALNIFEWLSRPTLSKM